MYLSPLLYCDLSGNSVSIILYLFYWRINFRRRYNHDSHKNIKWTHTKDIWFNNWWRNQSSVTTGPKENSKSCTVRDQSCWNWCKWMEGWQGCSIPLDVVCIFMDRNYLHRKFSIVDFSAEARSGQGKHKQATGPCWVNCSVELPVLWWKDIQ